MSARAVIPAFMLCAACSAQTGSAPTLLPSALASSGSAVADASGAVDVELSHKTSGVYIDEDGLGFSYVLGLQGTSWAAYSALGHWTPPPDLPSGGKIKFNAQYAIGVLRQQAQGAPDVERYNGTFELLADLDAQRLSGETSTLSISGVISGSDLDGSVSFRGISGELRGKLSRDYAQGAFQGQSDEALFAGGFKASRKEKE